MKKGTIRTITVIAATIAISTPLAEASTLKADRATTHLAASIVRNSEQADRALTVGKMTVADSYIDRALSDQTKMAQIVRTDGTSMVVPLYTELDDTATLATALKNQTGRDARAGAGAFVRRNAADFTTVAIDVTKAGARLSAAKKALANHDTRAAKVSLDAIGSDFVVTSVAADLPMLTAREDLSLAQTAIDQNRPKIATADLKEAAIALGRYKGPAHSNQVRSLASTIGAQAPQTHDARSASVKIDSWWTSLKAWFSRHA